MVRNKPYWLADLIYPKWCVFQHTILEPITTKKKLLVALQEAVCKDVERAFGVLQAKWHVVAYPGRLWSINDMAEFMRCVIILHSMMVEENNYTDLSDEDKSFIWSGEGVQPMWGCNAVGTTVPDAPGSIAAAFSADQLMHHRQEYALTRKLIIDHPWMREGETEE